MTSDITPHASESFEPGAILECSWGYDQTNVDYYVVIKRTTSPKGTVTLTLASLATGPSVETGFMAGRCEPGTRVSEKTFRRKLHSWDGVEKGVSINSYSWAGLWDGKQSYWTAYA